MTRALAGRTIVVTRPAAQADPFVRRLEGEGARVLRAPTIAVAPPPSWEPLDRALGEIGAYAWIVFTSVNGVAMVGRRLADLGLAWDALAGPRVAAIGPATAAALAGHGVPAEAVPGEYRAEGLLERLRGDIRPGDRVLLPRAARTRDVLVTGLRRLGAVVTEIAAYVTEPVTPGGAPLREALAAGTVDVVTFTSSSTVRHFVELFTAEERRAWLRDVTVAAIGPVTAATAAEYGLTTRVMPREYTIPALVAALVEHFAGTAAGAGQRSP